MNSIKIVIHGALGKMGQEVIKAVSNEPGMQVVGAVDKEVAKDTLSLPGNAGTVSLSANLDQILTSSKPDVLVDFSTAKATMPAVRIAVKQGVNLVIGTTGLTADDVKEIEQLAMANQVGAVVAPNFALGAVLMIYLAKIAAKYFDYAEIIELHHHLKADAPSGTALSTARLMAAARGKPFSDPDKKSFDSRAQKVEGITLHSVRLPGLMAQQEILLGAPGQTLSIRHDAMSRECFMPGIIMAIREVVKSKKFIYGLDALLGL